MYSLKNINLENPLQSSGVSTKWTWANYRPNFLNFDNDIRTLIEIKLRCWKYAYRCMSWSLHSSMNFAAFISRCSLFFSYFKSKPLCSPAVFIHLFFRRAAKYFIARERIKICFHAKWQNECNKRHIKTNHRIQLNLNFPM